MQRSAVRQAVIPKAFDYPVKRPLLKKTRSWRGLMQVRYDDTRADRNSILKNALVWSPLRVVASGLLCAVVAYYYLGHDQFMFSMFGYESEALVESRVNLAPSTQQPMGNWAHILGTDRAAGSPIRKFETPAHPLREFNVFKKKDTAA